MSTKCMQMNDVGFMDKNVNASLWPDLEKYKCSAPFLIVHKRTLKKELFYVTYAFMTILPAANP